MFQFCGLKTEHRCIFQEVVTIAKKELSSVVDSLREFLKTFDKARKYLEITAKPKIEIGSTKSKDNLFAH